MTLKESFLTTEISLGLPGKILRSVMPFSDYDPVGIVWTTYQQSEVKAVLVLTEPQEYLVRARRDLPEFYRQSGLEAITVPIRDYHPPDDVEKLTQALEAVEVHLRAGRNVAVHCMAGIGRTGIFLACLGKRLLNIDGEEAIRWVRGYIPEALENLQQENFVLTDH